MDVPQPPSATEATVQDAMEPTASDDPETDKKEPEKTVVKTKTLQQQERLRLRQQQRRRADREKRRWADRPVRPISPCHAPESLNQGNANEIQVTSGSKPASESAKSAVSSKFDTRLSSSSSMQITRCQCRFCTHFGSSALPSILLEICEPLTPEANGLPTFPEHCYFKSIMCAMNIHHLRGIQFSDILDLIEGQKQYLFLYPPAPHSLKILGFLVEFERQCEMYLKRNATTFFTAEHTPDDGSIQFTGSDIALPYCDCFIQIPTPYTWEHDELNPGLIVDAVWRSFFRLRKMRLPRPAYNLLSPLQVLALCENDAGVRRIKSTVLGQPPQAHIDLVDCMMTIGRVMRSTPKDARARLPGHTWYRYGLEDLFVTGQFTGCKMSCKSDCTRRDTQTDNSTNRHGAL